MFLGGCSRSVEWGSMENIDRPVGSARKKGSS